MKTWTYGVPHSQWHSPIKYENFKKRYFWSHVYFFQTWYYRLGWVKNQLHCFTLWYPKTAEDIPHRSDCSFSGPIFFKFLKYVNPSCRHVSPSVMYRNSCATPVRYHWDWHLSSSRFWRVNFKGPMVPCQVFLVLFWYLYGTTISLLNETYPKYNDTHSLYLSICHYIFNFFFIVVVYALRELGTPK